MTEEMDNIVVLTDEDGNEVQFEHVVTVTHKNKEYVCLIPIEGIDYGEDEDENALIFLEILPGKNGEEDVYQGVEDEKLLNELYAKSLEAGECADDEECRSARGRRLASPPRVFLFLSALRDVARLHAVVLPPARRVLPLCPDQQQQEHGKYQHRPVPPQDDAPPCKQEGQRPRPNQGHDAAQVPAARALMARPEVEQRQCDNCNTDQRFHSVLSPFSCALSRASLR